jgi:N-acetylglucosamine-6-phosphate deacetylase
MKISSNIPGKGPAQVVVGDDCIESVRLATSTVAEVNFISAGFVDIQVNGFAGVDFSDPRLEPEQAAMVLPAMWKTGVTSFCPTLITNTADALERNFRVLERARTLDVRFAQSVPGYHLEGPYLSSDKAYGAHNPDLMHAPDWIEFSRLQDAAGGNIAIITLAPELPGAIDFIHRASAAGVIVALGHTDAGPEKIHAAIDAGAKISTHLGNGCATFIHRHQNPLWAQIASDQLQACVICDGFHLPPDLLRVIVKVKSIERCILVTDAVHVATLPAGSYSLVGRTIELLHTGQVITADGLSMAGSALSMNAAVATFMDVVQTSLAEALQTASTNPGKLFERAEICLEVAKGQPANLVMFTRAAAGLEVQAVVLHGRQVYGENEIGVPRSKA